MCNAVAFCGNLKSIDGYTWNSDKWRCDFSECNGKLNEDIFIVLVEVSSGIVRAR